uniref:Receptor L-domain domain-containing protein n=1 Tax=Panagrellus redivivus TaxID=6233 RepID=A0A7E4V5W1_PANRE
MIFTDKKVILFVYVILIQQVFSALPKGCLGWVENYGFVLCANVSFDDTIEHFRGLRFRLLQFENCSKPIGHLKHLPPIDLSQFGIINCGITEIDDAVFADLSVLPDVNTLDFQHNNITKIPSLGVKQQLRDLNLDFNKSQLSTLTYLMITSLVILPTR